MEFALDRNSPVPFYRQIVDQILAGISGDSIAPGDRLPTIRDLAVRLGVNPNTIVKAYSQLELLGVLDTQQGSGVFVRSQPGRVADAEQRRQAIDVLCRDFVGRAQLQNITIQELIDHLSKMLATLRQGRST